MDVLDFLGRFQYSTMDGADASFLILLRCEFGCHIEVILKVLRALRTRSSCRRHISHEEEQSAEKKERNRNKKEKDEKKNLPAQQIFMAPRSPTMSRDRVSAASAVQLPS